MPATIRTWYIDKDVAIPDNTTAALVAKSYIWLLKSMLKGVSTGTNGASGAPPVGSRWTVVGSSDGVTASATDLSDRWGDTFDATKIVQASSGARSWIILQSPTGIAANGPYYLLLYLDSATTSSFHAYGAKTAFSGGSTTTRPTSTDEVVVAGTSSAVGWADTTTLSPHRMSRITDANGNFFVLLNRAGSTIFHTLVAAQKISNLPGTHASPMTWWWDTSSHGSRGVGGFVENANNNGSVASLFHLIDVGIGIQGRTSDGLLNSVGNAAGIMMPSGRGTFGCMLQQTNTNPMTGLPDAWDAKYVVVDSASKWYCGGGFEDIYLVNRSKSVGTGLPSSGNATHIVVNNLLIPCDGALPTV